MEVRVSNDLHKYLPNSFSYLTQRCFCVSVGVGLFAELSDGLVDGHVVRQHCVADKEFQFVFRTVTI